MTYEWNNNEVEVRITVNVKDENDEKSVNKRLLNALDEVKKRFEDEMNFFDETQMLDSKNTNEETNTHDEMELLDYMNSADDVNTLEEMEFLDHMNSANDADSLYKFNTLEEDVVRLLKEKRYTLTAAESCTGGLFMSHIVNVSGASEVMKQGYVTYSEEAKMNLLGVKKETLDTFGVVSEEIAREMAMGAAKNAHADVAIGITGVAGPSGGTRKTPVGTVCIGLYIQNQVFSKQFVFNGNREQVREQSVVSALELVHRKLGELYI